MLINAILRLQHLLHADLLIGESLGALELGLDLEVRRIQQAGVSFRVMYEAPRSALVPENAAGS